MSKKKNKFKRSGKKHSQRFSNPVVPVTSNNTVTDTPESAALAQVMGGTQMAEPIKTEVKEANTPAVRENPDEIGRLNEKYLFVRHDVRKLLIILGILVILSVAFYFVEIKTTLFDTVGNWVYKVADFQI